MLIVPLQTSFEEIFVRGFLFQGIGLATKSGLAAVLITSAFFMIVHLGNPEIAEFGTEVMITYYSLVGLFLGVMTFLDDGLELALGVHAMTNIYGSAFVTFDGSVMQTETLLRVYEVNAWWMTLMFLITVVIFYVIVRNRYGFRPVSSLFKRIESQVAPEATENEIEI